MHLCKHPPPAAEMRYDAVDVLVRRHEEVDCLAFWCWLDIVDVHDVWIDDDEQ